MVAALLSAAARQAREHRFVSAEQQQHMGIADGIAEMEGGGRGCVLSSVRLGGVSAFQCRATLMLFAVRPGTGWDGPEAGNGREPALGAARREKVISSTMQCMPAACYTLPAMQYAMPFKKLWWAVPRLAVNTCKKPRPSALEKPVVSPHGQLHNTGPCGTHS